ncbi:MAG: hypothetical protein NTY48_02025 [Candidatus Diapherotrites archaeon]|nr:hypothetical protein [Candidatus Diapherotrites archaeon]
MRFVSKKSFLSNKKGITFSKTGVWVRPSLRKPLTKLPTDYRSWDVLKSCMRKFEILEKRNPYVNNSLMRDYLVNIAALLARDAYLMSNRAEEKQFFDSSFEHFMEQDGCDHFSVLNNSLYLLQEQPLSKEEFKAYMWRMAVNSQKENNRK